MARAPNNEYGTDTENQDNKKRTVGGVPRDGPKHNQSVGQESHCQKRGDYHRIHDPGGAEEKREFSYSAGFQQHEARTQKKKMQVLAVRKASQRKRSPQHSQCKAQKNNDYTEHEDGDSPGLQIQKGPVVGGENRATLVGLKLFADLLVFSELGLCPFALHKYDTVTVIARIVCRGRFGESGRESSKKSVRNKSPATVKRQNHGAALSQKGLGFTEAFEGIHVVVKSKS
jgi:hypothetical protein